MQEDILKALKKITQEKYISLETPEIAEHGDYSSNIAMQIASKKGKNPRDIAQDIVSKLKKDGGLDKNVAKIEVKGPGFINFWLSKDMLIDNLIQIDDKKKKYGYSDIGKGKTVIVDYSSPNIAKRFSIAHLRSTIIGASLCSLYKALGYEVIGDNHLGDWGTQFGKLLYMIDKEKLERGNLTLGKLEDLYIRFHQLSEKGKEREKMEDGARAWFKKLEAGDKKARQLWKLCVDVSMEEFDKIYKILNVKFDYQYGESFYESEMKMLEKDKKIQKNLSLGEDGKSEIINLEDYGINTPLMFKKSDGASTYATRDLACLSFRVRKWDPAIIIYEVGAEQTLHFIQVFAAAKKCGLVGDDLILYHTKHGLYLSSDGKKFQTRKGGAVKLESILDEAVKRARDIIESSQTTRGLKKEDIDSVSRMVGIGAIKYFDLSHAVKSDIVFDWENIMNLEGNSGPYIQYTYARCQSVLKKAGRKKVEGAKANEFGEEEALVVRSLAQYSGKLADAAKNYSPNILCSYLFDLARKFNNFYDKCKILESPKKDFRLMLTGGVGQIIKNGLDILGIDTPERM